MQKIGAYIIRNDQKECFPNKLPWHLKNPSKSSVTKISKVIIQKIISHTQTKTSNYQRKGTSSMTEWFVNVQEKEHSSFMIFDIESFYPSISERLF